MTKRLEGKHVAIVVLAVIVLAASIALWRRAEDSSVPQQVLAERKLDDGTKLVLSRSEQETFEAFLSLHATAGTVVWRKGIYTLTDPELRGLTVGPRVITIRAADKRNNHETHAFARKDGRFLWRGGRIKDAAGIAQPSERQGSEVVEYYGPPVNKRIRLSLANGDLLESEASEAAKGDAD